MSLANLFSPIEDINHLDEFGFSNQDSHILIINKLAEFGVIIPTYQLYPIPIDSVDAWAQIHQQAHNEANRFLGVSGQDYTGIDFNDAEATAAWSIQHAQEHRDMMAVLKIG